MNVCTDRMTDRIFMPSRGKKYWKSHETICYFTQESQSRESLDKHPYFGCLSDLNQTDEVLRFAHHMSHVSLTLREGKVKIPKQNRIFLCSF